MNEIAAWGAGSVGAMWLLRWLIQRAVAQIDTSLLRVTDRLDRVEHTQRAHGETLAVVAHTLGIRARKGPDE